MSTLDWIKNKLMGSSTMPAGTAAGHEHKHAHAHTHDHGDSCCSGLDHDHEEDSPKGGCC